MAERIIEHGNELYAAKFFEHIVNNSAAFSLRRFGSFVVEHLLEHNVRRQTCAMTILPYLPRIARTKRGQSVIRTAMENCDRDVQVLFATRLANHDWQ